MLERIVDLAYTIRDSSPLTPVLHRRYLRRFRQANVGNAWHGVYDSFAAATADAPADVRLGYDHDVTTTLYDDLPERADAKDYPVLFWLERVLRPTSTVFDFGGHVGVLYYAYSHYLQLDAGQRWVVCDVPAVVAAGAERARARSETALTFTTRFADVSGCDVLLASGSLQYVETPLADLLRPVERKPRHVLVNKLPTHAEREFITLQNIGVTYCPYRIARHDAIPESLSQLGYELVDSWENPETRTRLPFHPEATPITWVGYYLRLRG